MDELAYDVLTTISDLATMEASPDMTLGHLEFEGDLLDVLSEELGIDFDMVLPPGSLTTSMTAQQVVEVVRSRLPAKARIIYGV